MIAALFFSMLGAATLTSCEKEEGLDDSGQNGSESGRDSSFLPLDVVVLPMSAAEFLYACTDTSDSSTNFYDFPEHYMISGSSMENLVFWEVDGEIIQKSFDEYAIVGNGFISKSKDGKVEYYLKYQFTIQAEERSKEFASELWKQYEANKEKQN